MQKKLNSISKGNNENNENNENATNELKTIIEVCEIYEEKCKTTDCGKELEFIKVEATSKLKELQPTNNGGRSRRKRKTRSSRRKRRVSRRKRKASRKRRK
jgi:hypothetical protein